MAFIRRLPAPAQGGGGGATIPFTTTFPGTENPISESGEWIRNTNAYYHDNRTTGGNMVPASNASDEATGLFDDCYAHLADTWPADQEVIVTVYKGAATGGEIEIHLRATDSAASNMSVYECLFNVGGGVAIVRWNGTAGDITYLALGGAGLTDPGGCADGDKLRARIIGQTIDFWYAVAAAPTTWIVIGSVTDNDAAKLTSGKPGIGFFARDPASLDFGVKDFTATAA